MFKTALRYRELLAGPQRKPGSRMRHPLLVWHLGFWTYDGTDDAFAPDGVEPRLQRMNAYIERLYTKIKRNCTPESATFRNCKIVPEADAPSFKLQDEPIIFHFDWLCFRVTIRAQAEVEYVTLFISLDASPIDYIEFQTSTDATVRRFLAEMAKLRNLANADEETRTSADFSKEFSSVSNVSFRTTWEDVYKDILRTDDGELEQLGDVFADFRGLVLGEDLSLPSSDEDAIPEDSEGKTHDDTIDFVAIEEPFKRDKKRINVNQPSKFTNRKHRELRATFWWRRYQVLRALMMSDFGDGINFTDYELTASMFANERALYLSALGAQPAIALNAGERVPLFFVLYTKGLGSWSTGRLLEHMNRQGTLRLAAIYDLEALRKASKAIRAAETLVQRAYTQSAVQLTQTIRGRSSFDLGKTLSDIQNQLAIADKSTLGEIEYRTDKSRYYANKFRQGLKLLNESPFEDFQPYSRFVRSRLGQAFDYIEMIQSRYERVRRDSRALFEQHAGDQVRQLVETVSDRNGQIERLQTRAEIILFGILSPYYLGSIIDHFWPSVDGGMPKIMWAGFLALGIVSVILLLRIPPRVKWLASLGASLVSVALIVAAASIWPNIWQGGKSRGGDAPADASAVNAPNVNASNALTQSSTNSNSTALGEVRKSH
jgi:Protein of unknown function (DUF3422)